MKKKINSDDFRVRPGEKVKLRNCATIVKPFCESKKEYQLLLEEHVAALSSLQRLHYSSNRYALLLIFQGMDAAGKDGAIRHVMSGINPQGCQVSSFKQPSADELEHDFLWRTTRRLPERGQIGIFNRSYYEEVLIVRVHPELLRREGPSEELRDERTIWDKRYRSIVDLESHLYRNGTRTIKVFLHLSKDEQRKRFLDRIDEPDKNWKFVSVSLTALPNCRQALHSVVHEQHRHRTHDGQSESREVGRTNRSTTAQRDLRETILQGT